MLVQVSAVEWSHHLASHRFSSLFSSPAWIDVMTRTYGFNVGASVRSGHGAVDATILFSYIRDIRGSRIVCLPFSDYCDPLVEDRRTWQELMDPLVALNAPIRLRCLRNFLPDDDLRFTLYKRAKWHAIDLDRTQDELWDGLSGQARQNIRHACRSGVTVREGNCLEDIHLFHRMHSRLRKLKYCLLAQPAAFFDHLHQIFSREDRLMVLIAELDNTPLAGILLLQWRDALYYKFNATLDSSHRPNELLLWKAMLFGHKRGLRTLDLGLSDHDQPSLIRYKRKFATDEQDIRFLEWLPQNYCNPYGDEASEIFNHLTRLLTDPSVPDEITRAAGDKFYRFFA